MTVLRRLRHRWLMWRSPSYRVAHFGQWVAAEMGRGVRGEPSVPWTEGDPFMHVPREVRVAIGKSGIGSPWDTAS
jgi:hypothetical protein